MGIVRYFEGMKRLPYKTLLVLMLFPKLLLAEIAPTSSVTSFDLFGFPLSAADQGLVQRVKAVGAALVASLPKDFKAEDFHENITGGHCFNSGADQYKLTWYDSETEGFFFKVELLKNQKDCDSPYGGDYRYKLSPLNPAQFFPISRSHPNLKLGASTLAEVQKGLGKPAYSSADKLIYVLKRDKLKEKGCGYKPADGDFAAIEVQFLFSGGVLQTVMIHNGIAGEC